ncbi:MAG: YsnF/AvaK domain-containing protein [Chloroflexota bacterium]|nr:YsnF/AvaK domain-containing protein [Chloroflexota bacterium]
MTMSGPSPETFDAGMSVVSADGRTGTVEEVISDTGDPETTELAVRWDDIDDVEIVSAAGLTGAEMMDEAMGDDATRAAATSMDVDLSQPMSDITAEAMTTGRTTGQPVGATGDMAGTESGPMTAGTTTGTTTGTTDVDELVIPVREEVLIPEIHETDLGAVVIHKRVEEVPVSTSVDVEREQVSVERVEINRQVDTAPGPRQEGDTLIIPVVEEVLFTEKRLMLKEEIHVTRKRITERVPVEETLRREVVEFEERHDDVTAVQAATPAPGTR